MKKQFLISFRYRHCCVSVNIRPSGRHNAGLGLPCKSLFGPRSNLGLRPLVYTVAEYAFQSTIKPSKRWNCLHKVRCLLCNSNRNRELVLALFSCNSVMGIEYFAQARNQGEQEGRTPPRKIFAPLEKCIGHRLKLLDIVQKIWAPLRDLFAPPVVSSWLRA